jgi:hypothetical protein
VAFVYNNKLPFYIWGDIGNPGNFLKNDPDRHWVNPHYQLKSRRVHLSVPLPESGARQSWENKSTQDIEQNLSINTTSDFEGVPCDAQLPWKMFRQGSTSSVWGLTIYGEVYLIPAALSFSWVASPPPNEFWQFTDPHLVALCRMSRWQAASVAKPIKAIFLASQLYPSSVIAIDKDDDAWWLHDWRRTAADVVSNNIGDGATPIELPAGKKARFVTYNQFDFKLAYVVTTTDDKTCIRIASETDWYTLTGGCVEILDRPNLVNHTYGWLSTDLPTATVSAPNEENGVNAEVSIEFGTAYTSGGVTYRPLVAIQIVNPGAGYTQNAVVSFSRAPDNTTQNAPALALKLKPWLNYVVDHLSQGGQGRVDDVMSPALAQEAVGSLSPFVQIQGPSLLDNDGKTVKFKPSPVANGHWVHSNYEMFTAAEVAPDNSSVIAAKRIAFGDSEHPAYGIAQDGALYRQLSNAFGNWELVSSDVWVSLASSVRTYCGVKADGSVWTWGRNSNSEFGPKNFNGVYFGDGSAVDAQRTTPTQIANSAEWVSVWSLGDAGFIAIRKDAICRDIDQPMEYWPDWHFGG